jgi:hypothetical protein
MKRNPSLPPPDICDWLLSQTWKGPLSVDFKESDAQGSNVSSGTFPDAVSATVAIGRDDYLELFMDRETLDVLNEDARRRAAEQEAQP